MSFTKPTKIVVIGAGSASFGLNTAATLLRSAGCGAATSPWWTATPRRWPS